MHRKLASFLSVMLPLIVTVTLSGQDRNSQPASPTPDAAQTISNPPKRGTDWQAVQHLSWDHKLKVITQEGDRTRGAFISANEAALVIRTEAGERSIAREDVRRVGVYDPSRRTRNGLIATAIGAGIGLGVGFAVCPSCSNEGNAGKYAGPSAAAGAGIGAAAGFLPPAYRTVYKRKK